MISTGFSAATSRSTGHLLALAQSYQRLSCRTAIDIVLQLVPPAAQSILDPVFHSLHRTIMPGSIEGRSIRLKVISEKNLKIPSKRIPAGIYAIKFKNGTRGDFETYHAFGHKSDIAATKFIYRIENAISSTVFAIMAAVFLFGMFILSKFIKSARAKARNTRIRLADDEYPDYGTLSNVGAGPAA
ncbi:hypothetical protein F4604DRAFT_1948057 [Suillus subluteus]|nr:hypothetical protein F4604DRAFT_1948057 [Suillus subluteus]